MNFVNLFFAAVLALMPSLLLAGQQTRCSTLIKHASRVVFIEAPDLVVTDPLVVAAQATQVGTAVTTTLSVMAVMPPTQVAQGSRAFSILKMISCDNISSPDSGAPAWIDSPTQLSVGDSPLRYDVGTVVGNWLILSAGSALYSAAAYKFGMEKARFPGGLTLPVLFLITPTVGSAVTLVRDGALAQQFLGGCSLAAQATGIAMLPVFLQPSQFGARWDDAGEEAGWVDGSRLGEKGYIERFGMLFGDYRGYRQYFIVGELLMSTATGVLKSYQATESDCKNLLIASAAVTSTYALSLAVLRPNLEPRERIFYAGLAGLQAAAMTTQAIAAATASKETQDKIRPVTQSIVIATEWALTAKTLYDSARRIYSVFGGRIRSVWGRFRGKLDGDTTRFNAVMELDTNVALEIELLDRELTPDIPPTPKTIPTPDTLPTPMRARTPEVSLGQPVFTWVQNAAGLFERVLVPADNSLDFLDEALGSVDKVEL